MAIGLKSLSFLGMKTDLNLNMFGSSWNRSCLLRMALNTIANFFTNIGQLMAMYFKCFGPNPEGPALLCNWRFWIVLRILSSNIF